MAGIEQIAETQNTQSVPYALWRIAGPVLLVEEKERTMIRPLLFLMSKGYTYSKPLLLDALIREFELIHQHLTILHDGIRKVGNPIA